MLIVNNKLENLLNNQLTNHIRTNTENFIHNATNTEIPDDVKFLMGLEPKFGLPFKNHEIPVFNLIADLEIAIVNCVEMSERNDIRYNTTNILRKSISEQAVSSFDNFLLKKKKACIDFFKEQPEILCTRSDKGGKTVFMNKTDYEEKATVMLSDTSTYQPISDPTSRLQRLNNSFVKRLYESGKIDVIMKHKLTTYNASPPLMYFLPKHHKRDMPLRPISADLQGPMRALSEFASNILGKLEKSQYHIRNSYDFCDFIFSCEMQMDEEMFSFDVVSLFTNAPVNRIIDVIEMRWDEIEQHTNLNKREFVELITLCTNNSYFAYKNKCYKHCYGTPKGAPISPILVELLMDYILDKIQELMDTHSKRIRVIKKYVDDLFLLLPKGLVNEILLIFNSIEERIQFTFESEENNCIPFLDMTVHRDVVGKVFFTNWYRKPVASGRMLNFNSIHPMSQKISTALGLIDRVYRLSDSRFTDSNRNLLANLLKQNDYPLRLINRLINRYFHRRNSTQLTNAVEPAITNVKRFSLPFVPFVSKSIAKSVTEKCDNVKFAFKNVNNVGRLYSKLKDPIPINQATNMVYQFDCTGGDNKCYIGSSINLARRIGEHEKSVQKNQPEKSALAYHSITEDHRFDFDNVRILEREANYRKRMLLEELHIKSSRNCVNSKSIETKNVNDIYLPLLRKINK